MGAVVIDAIHDETRFDSGYIHGIETGRPDAVRPARRHQGVVEPLGIVVSHPDLVTQVAGVAGARNPAVDAVDTAADDPKKAQGIHVGVDDLFENVA